MLSTPKSRGELFLASSLRDGLEDNDMRQVETLLLSKEADPNVIIPTHGISPFHLVIGNESETFAQEVSKLFLRHGGDPNIRSIDGVTPVHVAAAWGRVAVLELLLANGGDPMCLDDEGRSPFHYAFDGAYYDAVATLGKYCGMTRDEEEEEEEEPKYKLTLEKILVNKGNVVAEYVPSEYSYEVSLKKESTDASHLERYKEKSESSVLNESPSSIATGSGTDSFLLRSNNVTLRRYNKHRSSSSKMADILSGGRGIEEEKLLVGRIIDRLSNTLTSESSTIGNDDESAIVRRRMKNTLIKKEEPRKLFAAPIADVKSRQETTRRRLAGDTSIISKSPNCRISTKNDKTPKAVSFKSQSNGCREKRAGTPPLRSSKPPEVRVKSASSTPKKKRYSCGRLYGTPKISQKETKKPSNFRPANEKKVTTTSKIRGRNFVSPVRKEKIIGYSPETEISDRRNINRRYEGRNIAIRLDDRMYDENPEISECDYYSKCDARVEETVPSRPVRIYNDTKTSVKEDNGNVASLDDQERRTIKSEKIFNSQNREDRRRAVILESPGSSNPLSVCFQITQTNKDGTTLRDDEETKILLEIEEACKNRCPTPPASVSVLDIDEDLVVGSTRFRSDYSSGEQGSVCEFYEAPAEPGTMACSLSRSESFVSVEEEYTYEDPEEGIAFTERRLCVIPSSTHVDVNRAKEEGSWIDRLGQLSICWSECSSRLSPSSSTLARSAAQFNDQILRERLCALGEIPGPITKTTFNVYLKRLWRLERARERSEKISPTESPRRRGGVRSSEKERRIAGNRIPEYLLLTDWETREGYYRNIEEVAFKEYATSDPRRKYRGGISKTSFCYLLLDPRVTRDLPRCGICLTVAERWRRFLEGIFYIGKGKAARPVAHLYDAFGVWSKRQASADEATRKIRRILDIWQAGQGVVCLHVFSHAMQEEACSREASMIEAIGTSHLTNCLHGTYYGYSTTMSSQEKRSLGKYLLYKSMEIFMHEGERQLFPRNVIL